MGHHMSNEEYELINESLVFYNNNKFLFIRDFIIFIICNILLFYSFIYFQN